MSSDTELIPLISRGLDSIVNSVIGPECIVKLRRERWDILNVQGKCVFRDDPGWTYIMSGSQAEGFQMKTSDFDAMFVFNDVLVLPSYHPLPQGSIPQKCVLIYDTDYTSPGFAIIRCSYLDELNDTHNQRNILHSLVWNSLGPCVCSKLFREFYLGSMPSTEIHGPCVSGELLGGEFDFAFCLQSPYWPRQASSFIPRSIRSGWPSIQVVTDICNDGCLFVPISSKALHCQDAVEMEWRMSFSLAERKLVLSMNHCQFLCYGLLKLFLNEVLKKTENINDLLCSYFMKTAVFWEISEDKSGWTSEHFLCKFWKTFCRLLRWVHIGYCPNFFNPDNNMFFGKIHGRKQGLLMEALSSFHREGVLCLLKCSSLNLELTKLLQLTIISRPLNIDSYISFELVVPYWVLDSHKILCIINLSCFTSLGLSHAFKVIRMVRNVNPTSPLMKAAIKFTENKLLLMVGEIIVAELATANYRSIGNRTWKKHLHTALNIVYKNGTFFCESELIAAKSFFILGMFHNAIQILRSVKTRLHCAKFMYTWTNNEACFEILHRPGTSYNSFIKSNIANIVYLTFENPVSEILIELRAGSNSANAGILCIPPLVFVHFLLILSYHHLGDTVSRNDLLRNLNALMRYDEGYHIHRIFQSISWEILGICQQLCGDCHGAYQSYINALNDKFNNFTKATIIRICCTITQQLNA